MIPWRFFSRLQPADCCHQGHPDVETRNGEKIGFRVEGSTNEGTNS